MRYKGIGYIILGLAAVAGWWFCLSDPLFDEPYSTVLLDKEDEIIGVTVAEDEQFRFPVMHVLPPKYVTALMAFEDNRFLFHHGVDWLALARAMKQNITSGKVVSGGSTISMQVIRLSRRNPPRTYYEKLREIISALRLEQSYSKYEIMQMYAAHAPFGGNIVGLGAACRRYFNRNPDQLSWAEAALLAVLPNAPSLKNDQVLKGKRDELLKILCDKKVLSNEDYLLAVAEPLPTKVTTQENIASHLQAKAAIRKNGQVCRTYIDSHLQRLVNEIVARHSLLLGQNLIYNASVLVAHVPSGEVRAYVGNSPVMQGSRGNNVDVVTSVRSSGSILKPALYALMQQNGFILPKTLVADVPSRFGGYAPSNFNRDFQGVAPADKALSKSLNIPFVRLLKDYNYGRFYEDLKKLGITSLSRTADDYGLSLILGGAETSLWDLCNMYGGMASVLRHYGDNDGVYYQGEYERLKLWRQVTEETTAQNKEIARGDTPLSAAAIWLTLEALKDVERPDMESGWKNFASNINLSWKTGTSFGFRDAWAVGVNPDWVVGVWVGNADGEGRPGLVGVRAAAPILFEVAGLLPVRGHFYEPVEEMKEVVVCRKSGYRASQICDETDTVRACDAGDRTGLCPYHRLVNLDASGQWRVDSDCEPVDHMQIRPWFVLTPVQEWYYVRTHSDYRKLPPYRSDCKPAGGDVMEMIYPQKGTKVLIPLDFGGQQGHAVFEVAHRTPSTGIFWHIDEVYIGSTYNIHQMQVNIAPGLHVLTLVDADGNTLRQTFRVVGETAGNFAIK